MTVKVKQMSLIKDTKRARTTNTTKPNGTSLPYKPQQVSLGTKGISVGKDWKVTSDPMNIILSRRQVNQKTVAEYWRAEGYFATIAGALSALVDQGIRDTQLADLKLVVAKIEELKRDILKWCAR